MAPNFLTTTNHESFQSWGFRVLMNLYPMYFGTGGKVLFWSGDWREVHLRLKRSIWSYNYVGTIFGGSMFAAADPFYMIMLLRCLGRTFVAWDKGAEIKFRKPARKTLYTRYLLTPEVLEAIKARVATEGQTTENFVIQWQDAAGLVYAEITRTCYIADKQHYETQKGERQSVRLGRN